MKSKIFGLVLLLGLAISSAALADAEGSTYTVDCYQSSGDRIYYNASVYEVIVGGEGDTRMYVYLTKEARETKGFDVMLTNVTCQVTRNK